MRQKWLLALALLVAACSGDDDDGGSSSSGRGRDGCPVDVEAVEAAVGHPVEVEEDGAGPDSCAYLGADEASAGARIDIAVRDLRERGFAEVRADVERRSGPTVALPDGLVDGADDGWLAVVGRAVQVGAADGDVLVIVAVTDPLLDAASAREVAGDLAGEALDG